MDIKNWIINWLENNSGVSTSELEKLSAENYFELELIDSFSFIALLSDIGEEFGIELDNDEFLDRSFATIDGLAAIIKRHISNES